MNRRFTLPMLAIALALITLLAAPSPVLACGGLFCQTNPVDQNAERIIFTQNGDGTISAIIQIEYTGFDDDFSWVLPIPTEISGDDLEVPETGNEAFLELEPATNPVFIPPPTPECAMIEFAEEMEDAVPADAGSVEVLDSGSVGPYGFDIITSPDPEALITWLRDNEYVITQDMEPLVAVYVDEGMPFLAMRLQPEFGVQDIQPIKITYQSDAPMIPLRLTAVAANPDMAVIVWIYGDAQAVPENYAHMEIDGTDLTFFTFGGHNYRQLMGERADENNGQAFITEYAQPTSELPVADPLLVELHSEYQYVTRLNTVISPEEMTVDPVFSFDQQRPDVSNIHDLSEETGLYDCERDGSGNTQPIIEVPFGGNAPIDAPIVEAVVGDDASAAARGLFIGAGIMLGLIVSVAVLVGAGIFIGRRMKRD